MRDRSADRRIDARRAALDEMAISFTRRAAGRYPHELCRGRDAPAPLMVAGPRSSRARCPARGRARPGARRTATRSDIMASLDALRRERGLAVVSSPIDLSELLARRCLPTSRSVMYAGSSSGRALLELLDAPLTLTRQHLLAAHPDIAREPERLSGRSRSPVAAAAAPSGCPFPHALLFAEARCAAALPELSRHGGALVRCVRADELAATLAGIA